MAKHKVDKLFSDGLESFESAPAPSAWDEIENRLDQKKGRAYWAWAGIAASAALFITSAWLMFSEPATRPTDEFVYTTTEIGNLNQPAEVIYVPIYIHAGAKETTQPVKQAVNTEKNIQKEVPVQEEMLVLAKNEEIPVERPELMTLEEVPEVTSEEVVLASAEIAVDQEPAQLQPVTIIYKQGEPAKESNFVRAMNYMEDVRMGEKKLVNFEKLRENFRSRFRTEEGTD